MLSEALRILNFDGSLTQQACLLKKFHPLIVDLLNLGPACRLWASAKTAVQVKNALAPNLKNALTFLGSGDFHHVSSLLIEQFQEPLTVIVFDHHPDWDILPPRLGCGSWVSRILKMPNVAKVVLLGISSDDIATFSIQTGNTAALVDNRVEIYPYAHRPALIMFRRVPDNVSIRIERKFMRDRIYWKELANTDLQDFFFKLLPRIVTGRAYISIDKDCLQSESALTNWEEGKFTLKQLLLLLKLMKENLDIAGVDVTGEYSKPEALGRIKGLVSRLDHPKNYTARVKPLSLINSINEQANIKIIESLKN